MSGKKKKKKTLENRHFPHKKRTKRFGTKAETEAQIRFSAEEEEEEKVMTFPWVQGIESQAKLIHQFQGKKKKKKKKV